MAELIETHWLALVIVLALGLFVAWWLFGREKIERERHVAPDVLDEGAAPANRNQSLIDAPPAAAMDQLAGAGTVVSAAGGEDRAEIALAEEKTAAAAAATPPLTAAAPPVEPRSELATPAAPDVTAHQGAAEELAKLKGVGPKLRTQLAGMGITTIAQIAGWTEDDIDRVDAQLGRFSGRIRRDNWVGQARLLISGDRAAYEAKFGRV